MKLVTIGVILPIVGLILGRFGRFVFSKTHYKHVRTVDFLPPFLIAGCQCLRLGVHEGSVLELVIFTMVLMAVFLALFMALHNHELLLPRFLRIWWRLTFILSLVWFLLILGLTIHTMI